MNSHHTPHDRQGTASLSDLSSTVRDGFRKLVAPLAGQNMRGQEQCVAARDLVEDHVRTMRRAHGSKEILDELSTVALLGIYVADDIANNYSGGSFDPKRVLHVTKIDKRPTDSSLVYDPQFNRALRRPESLRTKRELTGEEAIETCLETADDLKRQIKEVTRLGELLLALNAEHKGYIGSFLVAEFAKILQNYGYETGSLPEGGVTSKESARDAREIFKKVTEQISSVRRPSNPRSAELERGDCVFPVELLSDVVEAHSVALYAMGGIVSISPASVRCGATDRSRFLSLLVDASAATEGLTALAQRLEGAAPSDPPEEMVAAAIERLIEASGGSAMSALHLCAREAYGAVKAICAMLHSKDVVICRTGRLSQAFPVIRESWEVQRDLLRRVPGLDDDEQRRSEVGIDSRVMEYALLPRDPIARLGIYRDVLKAVCDSLDTFMNVTEK